MDRFVQRSKPSTSRPPLVSKSKSTSKKREGPPVKNSRVKKVKDSDEEEGSTDQDCENDVLPLLGERPKDAQEGTDDLSDEDQSLLPRGQTAFESSLPAVATDTQAIEEYETMRASQLSHTPESDLQDTDGAGSRIENRNWVRGKSSIYVDAFNLALETVLEEESHLFDDKEKRVFEEWRGLNYESQYLFVPPKKNAETD